MIAFLLGSRGVNMDGFLATLTSIPVLGTGSLTRPVSLTIYVPESFGVTSFSRSAFEGLSLVPSVSCPATC